ncbi:MAG TPA: ATPase, T2SS/T4P/T4SS family [Caldimonas sp.]|jgi:type II secretory ATPase GspE/PulE/Tfp pilus assembly ATPase PilB-like protein|nr:ATPase, T2SS/T4P/T4SS family [Caldimonas sp.]HEX2542104.1 ATPase, T2SS/T4P/T4SS family [Caldimonas sp.]
MTDLSTPLSWDTSVPPRPPQRPAPAAPQAPAAAKDKGSRAVFLWPTPPYASYPAPAEQTETLPCQVTSGPNNKAFSARLTFFVSETAVAHVQMPPARTTVPLRFDQFTALTLTTPLRPLPLPLSDPHAQLLRQRDSNPYTVKVTRGIDLEGRTVGHVETDLGLFLFPPCDEDGSVQRMFVPRSAYSAFEIGRALGEVLVEEQHATFDQVTEAMGLQEELRSQKIGDILVTKHIVSPDQLLEAIEQQHKMPMVRIGEALLSLGMVRQAQLDEALQQQQLDRTVPIGEVLVRTGVVSRDDLQTALARKMGYPVVNLDAFPAEAEALRKLNYTVAARLRVMPLLIREGRLVVALDDPSRRAALDEIEFNADMKVVPVLARGLAIETALLAAYEKLGSAVNRKKEDLGAPITFDLTPLPSTTDQLVQSLEKEGLERSASVSDEEKPIEQSDNSLVRLLNNMIIEAHKDGVSDIHIESYPGKEKIRIRFRKDGVLRTYIELPPNYRNALIARVKIMCDLDISERRKPQDGKINFAKFSAQHRIELRVATIPTNGGLEDVVLRLLASAQPIPVDSLGLSERNLKALLTAVERPYGMLLCVGPTGSGKTTTLHSALSHINVPERKIWTAEDPVEITQPGLRQVQINPRIEWTFAKALRAFMRADPDVIMLGEIRDEETAKMAVEASLTGHLVLSTLHTNSAPETVTRLLDMGMDPFNFADSLLAVLAQRLVRKSCRSCRTSRAATAEEVDELLGDYMAPFGADPPVSRDDVLAGWTRRNAAGGRLQLHRSTGCDKCDHTGFKGRAGVHELMVVSRELRRLIQNGARAEALQAEAMKDGMRTLRQDGIDKVLAGLSTIEEVRATSNA